jgi:hypothetical protein
MVIVKQCDVRKAITPIKETSLIPPLINYFKNSGYITCTEFRTPWAIPDVLAVSPNTDRVQQRILKGQIIPLTNEIYWKILDLIPDKNDSFICVTDLADQVNLSPSYLRTKILKSLSRNHYIDIEDDKCVKINGFHPYSNTLVSVEAKVKDWKRAGEQALRHQHFVNQAYVALPSRYINPALKNINDFQKSNLGLLEISEDNKILQRFIPEYLTPVWKTLYNVALDTLWSELIREELNHGELNLHDNNYSEPLFHTSSVT